MSTILADDNDERASRCEPGLNDYARASYGDPRSEDAATKIGDMISALLHLAQREGANPIAVVQAGLSHYCAERADPDGIGPDIHVTIEINGFSPASDIFPRLDALAELIDDADDEDAINAAVEACMSPLPPIEYLTPTPTVFILSPTDEPMVGDWVQRDPGDTEYPTLDAARERNRELGGRNWVFEVWPEGSAPGADGWRIKDKH